MLFYCIGMDVGLDSKEPFDSKIIIMAICNFHKINCPWFYIKSSLLILRAYPPASNQLKTQKLF